MGNKPQTKTKSNNLILSLDLMDFGIQLMRQNIIRREPRLTMKEVEARLKEWLFSNR